MVKKALKKIVALARVGRMSMRRKKYGDINMFFRCIQRIAEGIMEKENKDG